MAWHENGVPIVSIDYCFLRQEGEEESVTLMVMRDHRSRTTFANVVHAKGRGIGESLAQALHFLPDWTIVT